MWTKERELLKVVAILGPYFGDGKHDTIAANIKEAESYAIALASLGIGFFCPHTHTRHFEELAKADEHFYYALDMMIYSRAADAALLTPRWRSSKGAVREHTWCQNNNIRCFFPTSVDDMNEIMEWNEETFNRATVRREVASDVD
jgi:hypothetical protein